jgi:hypothetical protein
VKNGKGTIASGRCFSTSRISYCDARSSESGVRRDMTSCVELRESVAEGGRESGVAGVKGAMVKASQSP